MILLPRVITEFRGEYMFLSNMCHAPMIYDDIPYLNSESAYQSAKVMDKELRREFINFQGFEAKEKAKYVQLRYDWGEVKEQIMYDVVLAKFQQNPHLAQKLRDTHYVPLVEVNKWHDRYWGVCGGTGLNKLGIILMKVREVIGGMPYEPFEIKDLE